MTDKDLIKALQSFRKEKPRKEWVVLSKKEILGNDIGFHFAFPFRFAIAGVSFLFLFATFALSQNALPGDFLYSIRKITEKNLASLSNNSMVFNIADKRLDDLKEIAEKNYTKNLAPAINEYKASVSKAAKSLAQKDVKDVLENIKKLEEKKETVESLGIVIGEETELQNVLAEIVDREIKDLESRTLTEQGSLLLEEAKKDRDNKDYQGALEKILQVR